MGFFDFLKPKKDNTDWNKIRMNDEVYPDNAISVLMTQSESGRPATGWIDLGYKEYAFKKHCPYNLQFNIWIDESTPEELDMGTIEDYFINILKKECVVHPVARVATDFGMIMDFYIDNPKFAQNKLAELSESDDKLVEFGCGFNKDPKWDEYNRLTELTLENATPSVQSKLFLFAGLIDSLDNSISQNLLSNLNSLTQNEDSTVSFSQSDKLITATFDDVSYYISLINDKEELNESIEAAKELMLTINLEPLTAELVTKRFNDVLIEKSEVYQERHVDFGLEIFNQLIKIDGIEIYSFQ